MQRKRVAALGFFVIVATIVIIYTAISFVPHLTLDYSKSYVVYFEGPLTGLQVGSPVTIRGIKVGQVSDFKLKFNKNTNHFIVPVYINFYRKSSGELADHNLIRKLIAQGLRAELHIENLLTGSAAIEIEFRPGSKGYVPAEHTTKYVVIPSVPDNETASDLNQAIDAAKQMFDSIKNFTESEQLNQAVASVKNAAGNVSDLSKSLNDQIPVLTSHVDDSFQELGKAAYSIRNLSDYLTRHPEALIKGKGGP